MLFASKSDQTRAFEQQITPHITYLLNLARYFSNSQADAEDIVQDVLIKLHKQFHRWQTSDNPRPYLARAVFNQFVDHGRRNKRHSNTDIYVDDEIESTPSKDNNPDLAAEHALTRARLTRALTHLNDDQRAVVVLHDIEGFTYEEIGAIQNIPVGTAKSRHNRARRALAELL